VWPRQRHIAVGVAAAAVTLIETRTGVDEQIDRLVPPFQRRRPSAAYALRGRRRSVEPESSSYADRLDVLLRDRSSDAFDPAMPPAAVVPYRVVGRRNDRAVVESAASARCRSTARRGQNGVQPAS